MKKFFIKHSRLRRILDIIDDFFDRFVILYWVSLGLSIAIPTIVVFYSLPNDIRVPISGIVSAAISLILMPVSINYFNQKNAQRINTYNLNRELYFELSDIIIELLSHHSDNGKCDNYRLKQYIINNYCKMCLLFKTSIIWDIISLYDECEMSLENVNYYCVKILRKLRKQAGINDKFSLNNKAITIIKNNKEEYKMAVHHGGKVGKAGKTLASKSSSKSSKSKAGKTLANHKAAKH